MSPRGSPEGSGSNPNDSYVFGISSGVDGVLSVHHPLVTLSPQAPPTVAPAILLSGGAKAGDADTPISGIPTEFAIVVVGQQAVPGQVYGSSGQVDPDDRCFLSGVGSTFSGRTGQGSVVTSSIKAQHQLVGVESDLAGPSSLSLNVAGDASFSVNRQHDCKSLHQQAGGTHSKALMPEANLLLSWAEEHLESLKAEHFAGASNVTANWLSQQTVNNSEWWLHPEVFQSLVTRCGLPVMDLFATPQNTQLLQFLSRFQMEGVGGTDALQHPWPRGLLCTFPAPKDPPIVPKKGKATGCGGDPGGAALAKASLVSGCSTAGHRRRLGTTPKIRLVNTGSTLSSSSRALPLNSVEVERQALAKRGYSNKIFDTLLASKKLSTARVYNNTWKKFTSWCLAKGWSPFKLKTRYVLEFLQDGLDKGLSTSTLRWQVAAL